MSSKKKEVSVTMRKTKPMITDEVVVAGTDFYVVSTTDSSSGTDYMIFIEEDAYDSTPIIRVPRGAFEQFQRFVKPSSSNEKKEEK